MMPGWAILEDDADRDKSMLDGGFTVDEVSLVRGMARVLELTLHARLTLAAERRQAEENSRLLRTLQVRQRLVEQISEVQRAITRRAPLLLDAAQASGAPDAAFNRFIDFFTGLSSGVQVQSLLLANPAPRPIRSRPAIRMSMSCTFKSSRQPSTSSPRLAIAVGRRPT